MVRALLQHYHLNDQRAVVSVIIALTFIVALVTTDANSYAIVFGIGVTALACIAVLFVSYRYTNPAPLWFAIDLSVLISGLIAIFIGFAKYQDSERSTGLTILKAQVVERHLSFLRSAKISYFECSRQAAAPVVDPRDNCSRLGHFISQIEDELQRPSLIENGEGNRWDLDLCPEEVRAASASWGVLCESARSLADAQGELRNEIPGGRKLEGKVWSQFPKRAAAPEQLALQAGA
jgi:hypothetical protein